MKRFMKQGGMATRRMAGITLIELIVVMTIIAILSAIAIPSYQSYTTRANRAAARACVTEMAQYMERYYTTNLTYVVPADPVLGCQSENDLENRYTFDLNPAPTQRTYRIRAVPINAQLTHDTKCGTMTVNQAGLRTASGTDGVAGCW
jgi:type IV pilus assembly protein PilE